MTWFKVDDKFHDHRKVRKLGRDKVAAVGLWTLCGNWSADNTTDGFVPDNEIRGLDPRFRLARRLVEVGLWRPTTVDGEPGYQFHQWEEHQPTRDEVLDKRRKRQEAGRLGGIRSGQSRRSKPEANAVALASPGSEASASGELSTTKLVPAGNQVKKRSRTVPSTTNHDSATTSNGTAGSHKSQVDGHIVEANADTLVEPRPDPSRPVVPAGNFDREGARWQTRDEPPPPRCPKHLDTPTDAPCRPCGDARRHLETWNTHQANAKAALLAELDQARADPRQRCHHGTDGGRHRRSDTGESLCALCRTEAAQRKAPA